VDKVDSEEVKQDTIVDLKDTIIEESCYAFYDKEPEFDGGKNGLLSFIIDNTEYPETAIEDSVEGNVYVQFTINEDGSVSSPIIMKGVRHDLNEESKRVIGIMPKWKPAEHEGKPMKCRYNLPFNYRLNSKAGPGYNIIPKKDNKKDFISLKVYPNPVTDIVNIELTEFQAQLSCQIINVKGELVRKDQLNSVLEKLNISELESGLYIIQLVSKDKGIMNTQKLIKK
jgi:TonB family protein